MAPKGTSSRSRRSGGGGGGGGGGGTSSSAGAADSTSLIPVATWPEAAPMKFEEKFISVICGPTHWHWATHYGTDHDCIPNLFWRTPTLMPEEKQDDPCMVLFRHVPKAAHELMFGNDEAPPTKQGAASVAATRRIPAITVYVITSSDEDEESLQFMFKDVPHRIFKLRAEDFLSSSSSSSINSTEEATTTNGGTTIAEDTRFKGLSAKRAASVAGALDIGTPVLVFEAGTALTYTAIDSHGKVLGGGVSPGFNARFRALSDFCDTGVARIHWEEFKRIQWEAMEKKQPLDIFAGDLKSEIHTDVLCEVAGKCRSVIKHFLRHAQDQKDKEKENNNDTPTIATATDATADNAGGAPTTTTTTATDEAKHSHEVGTPSEAKLANPTGLPIVVATGGDSEIIKNLLSADHSFIVPVEPETSNPVVGKDFALFTLKHLQHYGLASILIKQSKLAEGVSEADPINQIRSDLIGQRVAKHFPVADLDGEFVYRGSIVSIRVGAAADEEGGGDKMSLANDWFFVRYDDGDKEHVDLVTLYDGLELYKKVGEKAQLVAVAQSSKIVRGDQVVNVEESLKTKKDESSRLADKLIESESSIQAEQKRRAEAKTRGAATGTARASKPPGMVASKKRPTHDDKKGSSPAVKKSRKNPSPPKQRAPNSKEDKKTTYLNKRVAKEFQQEDETGAPFTEVYFGTIDAYVSTSDSEHPLWHVQYDDDDEEEYDEKDLKRAIKLYEREKANDVNPPLRSSMASDVEMVAPAGGTPTVAEEEDAGGDSMDVEAATTEPTTETTNKEDDPTSETVAPSPAAEGHAPTELPFAPIEAPAAEGHVPTELPAAPIEAPVAPTAPPATE